MDSTNLLLTASSLMDRHVSSLSLGDEIWWTIAPTVLPTNDGPRPIYVIIMHMKSPLLGGVLTLMSMIENGLELTDSEILRSHAEALIEGLRNARSKALSSKDGF